VEVYSRYQAPRYKGKCTNTLNKISVIIILVFKVKLVSENNNILEASDDKVSMVITDPGGTETRYDFYFFCIF
jgi:hypothetical protein